MDQPGISIDVVIGERIYGESADCTFSFFLPTLLKNIYENEIFFLFFYFLDICFCVISLFYIVYLIFYVFQIVSFYSCI